MNHFRLAPVIAAAALCFPARADLLGPTLAISGAGCRFPDVAYGNVSRRYFVVWADYNPPVVRIFGRLMNGDGTMPSGVFPITEGNFGGLFPAVAFNAANNEFLVTWDDAGDRGGVIYGQRVRGSDGALLGVNFPIGSIYGGIRSAVAWSPVSSSYLVTFWGPGPNGTAAEVYGQRVNASGALLGVNFSISSDAFFSGYPAISWAPTGNQYLVTWDNFDGNILGRRVNAATGGLLGNVITVATGGANDRSCVACDPAGARWLVQHNNGGNAGYSYDQYARFVRMDGTLDGGPIPVAHTTAFEGDTQFGGDIAFEPGAQRYFSSFGTDTGMGGQESLSSGAALGAQVVIGTGYYTSLNNAADPDTHRFLTAWEGLLGGVYTVLGQLYAAAPRPVLSFTATQGDTQTQLAWLNPLDPHFTGVMIRMKTGSYPNGPSDGVLVVDKAGAPGASDGFTHAGLTNWTTHYYAAFAHDAAPNHSPAAQVLATPRPAAVTVSESTFAAGPDGWTLDVWRANPASGSGTVGWDGAAGNIASGGTGATNGNDACTREGSTMTRPIPTAGHSSVQVEYDVMASLFAPPLGAAGGNCATLEGSLEDKLVVYYSTAGTGGPWTAAQTLSEGYELPCGWTHQFINLAGVPGVANNPNFALKFQWQFNAAADAGRIDNIRVLSGAITGLTTALRVTPGLLVRTAPSGQSITPDILKVSNTGGGTLNFSITENAPWLSLTPASGSSSGPARPVSVAYDTTSLTAEDYDAAITVSAPGADNAPLSVPATLHVLPPAQVWEPFAYYDGSLTAMGSATWTGAAASPFVLASGELNVSGGTGAAAAQRTAAAAGAGGIVAAEIKITGGAGTGDFFWSIFLDDAQGNNLARWYGGSRHARGRIGTSITPDMILTGAWDDLYVEIDTVANTSTFYFNGMSYGAISHGTTAGASIATVRFERNDRPTAAADTVRFDDLHLGPVDPTLPALKFSRDAGQIMLSWPAVRCAATLESATTLAPPTAWSAVVPILSSGRFYHTTATSPSRRFFRLRRP